MKSQKSQTNQIKENLIATLRALVGDESVQVEFREGKENNFFVWDQELVVDGEVVLPEIKPVILDAQRRGSLEQDFGALAATKDDEVIQFRAASDLAACYLLFHDKEIHTEKKFSAEEQKFFNEFEKIRVIANVKNSYRGVVKNILFKLEEDVCRGDPCGRPWEATRASPTLALVLLKDLLSEEILPKTSALISNIEKNLSTKILTEIKKLPQKISDQHAFALDVERILEMLKQEEEAREEKKSSEKNQQKEKNNLANFGQENIEAKEEENLVENQEEEKSEPQPKEQKISDLKEEGKKGEMKVKLEKPSSDEDQIEFKNAYKIYSSKFDEVIFPQKLIAKNELENLRDQLDLKLIKLQTISKKMSLKLKRKLLSKRNSFVEFDSSRGILDRKKLTRLVIDPLTTDIWVNSKNHEYQDTALTILLDNSGSMRGNPIVMSAMACEIIAGILEKFSVKTEIIGFTTADWKGGRARKLWESSGRPRNPGRLNELRHIIYKHFNQSFKKAKINLGLMLKEGVLKENIDGEALLFARSRLMQQSEKRKILLVISDGTPVDDSTASANDSDVLVDHLHHVVNKIEKNSQIEIVGIGIGHTTEEFYRNSITIKSLEELGDVMIEKITEIL